MAQLAVPQGGEATKAGLVQAVLHELLREFSSARSFWSPLHHGTFRLHWSTGRNAGQGDCAVEFAPTALSQSATDSSIRSADYTMASPMRFEALLQSPDVPLKPKTH